LLGSNKKAASSRYRQWWVLVQTHWGPYGIIEQGATDPYTQCGLEKVYPYNLKMLERLLIRHLPLKYALKEIFLKHGMTFN
jgi:hypothetical protein